MSEILVEPTLRKRPKAVSNEHNKPTFHPEWIEGNPSATLDGISTIEDIGNSIQRILHPDEPSVEKDKLNVRSSGISYTGIEVLYRKASKYKNPRWSEESNSYKAAIRRWEEQLIKDEENLKAWEQEKIQYQLDMQEYAVQNSLRILKRKGYTILKTDTSDLY